MSVKALDAALEQTPWHRAGREPTIAELDAWYVGQDANIRRAFMARLAAENDRASRCVIEDHHGQIRSLRRMLDRWRDTETTRRMIPRRPTRQR